MNFDTKHYEIEGLQIAWGRPLKEVRPMLGHLEEFTSYGGWPNRRGKCTHIFGLAANEFELRAPFEDRPVMQVIYQLAPITSSTEELHSPYLKQLMKVLGEPDKVEDLYRQADLVKGYEASSVVFSAKWEIEGIRISLSVYGGTRKDGDRLSAAGIFVDWIDEVKAARPFRERAALFEKNMAAQLGEEIVLKKFKFQIPQRPYRMLHYELKNPYVAEKDNELRAAQLALYKKELYQTPTMISAKLQANEIGYYQIPGMDKLFVSNQWDTVALDLKQPNEMIYWDVLPARGSGYRELFLKELRVEDSRNSETLLALIAQVEAATKQPIKRQEAYDD